MNHKLLYSEKWRWRWGKEKENDHEVVQKKKGRLKIRGWPASYLTWGMIDLYYDFINSCLIEKNTLWKQFVLPKRFARISFHNTKTEKISLAIFIKERAIFFFLIRALRRIYCQSEVHFIPQSTLKCEYLDLLVTILLVTICFPFSG